MCRQYPVTFFKFSADRWGFFSYLTRDKWVNLDADIIKTGSGSGMFLLIHHLTFPRDSYSDLISSQLSHHTLETSTEVRKSWFSSYKSLSCSFEFFIFLLRLSSFFFFFFQTGPQRGREGGKPEQMLYTHAAICCVKCTGGVWWSNCARLKSDILFECYFSERELKIDEIWHLHKPTEKKVISKTNFPGVRLSLTSSQPVITSQWNYLLIGKK